MHKVWGVTTANIRHIKLHVISASLADIHRLIWRWILLHYWYVSYKSLLCTIFDNCSWGLCTIKKYNPGVQQKNGTAKSCAFPTCYKSKRWIHIKVDAILLQSNKFHHHDLGSVSLYAWDYTAFKLHSASLVNKVQVSDKNPCHAYNLCCHNQPFLYYRKHQISNSGTADQVVYTGTKAQTMEVFYNSVRFE